VIGDGLATNEARVGCGEKKALGAPADKRLSPHGHCECGGWRIRRPLYTPLSIVTIGKGHKCDLHVSTLVALRIAAVARKIHSQATQKASHGAHHCPLLFGGVVLVACCIVHDPDIGSSPTIAIATVDCHESSSSAFKAVLADL